MGGLAGFFKSQLLNNEISNKKLNNDTAVKWMAYVKNQSEGVLKGNPVFFWPLGTGL